MIHLLVGILVLHTKPCDTTNHKVVCGISNPVEIYSVGIPVKCVGESKIERASDHCDQASCFGRVGQPYPFRLVRPAAPERNLEWACTGLPLLQLRQQDICLTAVKVHIVLLFWFGKAQLYRTVQAVAEKEEFQLPRHGLDAAVDVCSGDARQAINLLQSLSLGDAASAANSGDDSAVYESCGLPSPFEIGLVFDTLQNQRFSVAHEALSYFVRDKQFSLVQVLLPLVGNIIACNSSIIGAERVGGIQSVLADVERCLLQGGSESVAIGATVSVFHLR